MINFLKSNSRPDLKSHSHLLVKLIRKQLAEVSFPLTRFETQNLFWGRRSQNGLY
jgi:hypothetical protein